MPKKHTAYSDQFRFEAVLEVLKGNQIVAELCQEFGIAASQNLCLEEKA